MQMILRCNSKIKAKKVTSKKRKIAHLYKSKKIISWETSLNFLFQPVFNYGCSLYILLYF